jgi:hypothetical protein
LLRPIRLHQKDEVAAFPVFQCADNLANVVSISVFARLTERRIHTQLVEIIKRYPAVALLRSRQVGKTTLALNVAASRPSLSLDPESLGDQANRARALPRQK